MGLTYFKRFRMVFDLQGPEADELLRLASGPPPGYQLLPFSGGLVREHAIAKYHSFREELDANVFPCLGDQDGCKRLMKEIVSRQAFVPEATWLCQYRDPAAGELVSVGTIQGLSTEEGGAIQNIGVVPGHRGRGLGARLLAQAAKGFRSVGLNEMHLEVTTVNTGAIRFYDRIGFRRAEVVYKAAEVAGV